MTYRYLIFAAALLMQACSPPPPVEAQRYLESDALFAQLLGNVEAAGFEVITEIDHSRLGAESGSSMPPARVLIFSDPALDAAILQHEPLAALDLPLRALSYERAPGDAALAWNGYAFLASRYGLPDMPALQDGYSRAMQVAVAGVEAARLVEFTAGDMPGRGVVTIDSPFDFVTTRQKVIDAINGQDDTLWFGEVDFQARATGSGVMLKPVTLILFGAPEPGAKAMQNAPILGLDVFCQKFVIWEDDSGSVYLSFNDVTELAQRHDAHVAPALRVVKFRLKSVFGSALDPAN